MLAVNCGYDGDDDGLGLNWNIGDRAHYFGLSWTGVHFKGMLEWFNVRVFFDRTVK